MKTIIQKARVGIAAACIVLAGLAVTPRAEAQFAQTITGLPASVAASTTITCTNSQPIAIHTGVTLWPTYQMSDVGGGTNGTVIYKFGTGPDTNTINNVNLLSYTNTPNGTNPIIGKLSIQATNEQFLKLYSIQNAGTNTLYPSNFPAFSPAR